MKVLWGFDSPSRHQLKPFWIIRFVAIVSIVGKSNPSCRTLFSVREWVDVQLDGTLRIIPGKPEAQRIERELHGDERPLAPSHRAGSGLPGFHAKDQDPSLVWGPAEHEEHVRRGSGSAIRMAEIYS